jgi:hypothetical protein
MGIMAKWRELYKQSSLQKLYLSTYASNRNGLPRPTTDRVLESFFPLIDKKMPVLFKTETTLDIHRALSLKQDLGFELILGNIKEGWDVLPKLKSSGTKIFLSLDLPEALKKDSTISADSEKGRLLQRKEDFIGKYVSQANAFNQAGIKFGFSSIGTKAKYIRPNIKRMIDAGLSKDAALAALTINAAELLGVADRMGTIEKGKMANLFISDKTCFDEKAKVKYVIVEGVLFRCWDMVDKKDTKDVIEGSWSLMTETPQGKKDLKVVFKKLDKDYKGNIREAQLAESINLNSATYKNGKLRFVYNVKFEGTTYDIVVEGTVEGDAFKGKMNVGNFGSFPIEGKKDPKM